MSVLCNKNINDMPPRAAMGLPDYLTKNRKLNTDFMQTHVFGYRNFLVETLLNSCIGLEERIGAGNLLGILGDPRISVVNPNMIAILKQDKVVEIGSRKCDIDKSFRDFKDTGIIREWLEKEYPRHMIKLSPYSIGKYPVTNQEYKEFLLDTKWKALPSSWEFGIFPQQKSNHPVYTITDEDAVEYTNWLSAKTKRKFRLPTEAEWEYAAAGPKGSEFPWGDVFSSLHCNTAELNLYGSTPVGCFPSGASFFGIHDMAGNVEEYVSDKYAAYPGESYIADDLTNSRSAYRVARGGSFTRFRDLARCRRRHGHYSSPIYVMGMRLAEDIL